MARILFVAYGGGHVASLEPVYRAAKKAGHEVKFLALTTAQNFLKQRDVPYFRFRDLPGSDAPDVQAYGRKLASDLGSGPVEHEESIAYLGCNFCDLVSELGEEAAWEKFRVNGRQAFLPVATMKRALEWIEPDLVVSTSSPRAERAVILAARQRGIRAVCVVDLFCMVEVAWVGQAGFADRVCVLNTSVRNLLVKAGRRAEEVVTTGNPAFDSLARSAGSGSELRLSQSWTPDRTTILWASQVEPETHPFYGSPGDPRLPRIIEAELRRIVAKRDDLRLVVRYHPSEREKFVPGENVEFSPTSQLLGPLLHAVDVVVVMTSTLGLEAHLIGKPVVSVGGSVYDADVPFPEFGITTHAPSVRDLESVLGDLIERRPKAGNAAADASRGSSHEATANVMSVINSLLS